jgi:hypothetical protein
LINTIENIKFDETIYIILIPSFREMNEDIRNELWWNKTDCNMFYDSAKEELQSFINSREGIQRKHALTALYQPILFHYDPSYFT